MSKQIGIEVEFICNDFNSLEVIKNNIPSNWRLEIEDEEKYIYEIVSPPLYVMENYGEIFKVFSLLNILEKLSKITLNQDCGIHIHYDCYNLGLEEIKNIINNFSKNERDLFNYVHECRRNNEWCLPLKKNININNCESVLETAELLQYSGKCHSLNIYAYKKFKTLEVRLLEATSNFNRVISWINLLDKLVFNH